MTMTFSEIGLIKFFIFSGFLFLFVIAILIILILTQERQSLKDSLTNDISSKYPLLPPSNWPYYNPKNFKTNPVFKGKIK